MNKAIRTQTPRGHHVKTEAHRENALGQQRQRWEGCLYKPRKAEDFQQPPEAGKRKKRFSPRAFGENVGLPTPRFQTPGLQNLRELISVVLSHAAVGTLLWWSSKLVLPVIKVEEKQANSLAIPGRLAGAEGGGLQRVSRAG